MWQFEGETIHIDNMRVNCIVGVRPFEREHEQPLLLTISFPADFGRAAASGDLGDTVDYSVVATAARAFVREGQFELLENLARSLGMHLCERFSLTSVSLHVRKPRAINDSDGPAVSLTVRREGA